ncbi:hypothetical protein RCL_jg24225.t1 [Rhizophagus clarus]|uniref:Uncharacterized protein n=1 Tax=Rhizophagus clarus TaxID=94130 RepID=A0A8H3LAU2_9GLOM|nr:hypothetical protein RCL_jg24225.t1 [Rhizophagus clarus]
MFETFNTTLDLWKREILIYIYIYIYILTSKKIYILSLSGRGNLENELGRMYFDHQFFRSSEMQKSYQG